MRLPARLDAALGLLLAQASQSEGPPPTPFPVIARRVLILLAIMAVGASLVQVANPDPSLLQRRIETEKVTRVL